mmetsp:Transcript_28870/g.62227  ORF Transcript_28870/g.62227 Transcript_28870/m.62227 type:complete len:202 (-) Transcript_28870:648-1253(-)
MNRFFSYDGETSETPFSKKTFRLFCNNKLLRGNHCLKFSFSRLQRLLFRIQLLHAIPINIFAHFVFHRHDVELLLHIHQLLLRQLRPFIQTVTRQQEIDNGGKVLFLLLLRFERYIDRFVHPVDEIQPRLPQLFGRRIGQDLPHGFRNQRLEGIHNGSGEFQKQLLFLLLRHQGNVDHPIEHGREIVVRIFIQRGLQCLPD